MSPEPTQPSAAERVRAVVDVHRGDRGALLPVLHGVQAEFGYIDPELVPGVLFSNQRVGAENPGIEDMAPTALALFGVDRPAWMEGAPVL